MMKAKKFSRIITTICAIAIIVFSFVDNASAGAAIEYWSAYDSNGENSAEEECPIVVESERLVFDISEFPESRDLNYNQKSALFSNSRVSTEYSFCNAIDCTVNASFVFPIGRYNDYHDYEDMFDVTLNGEVIEHTLRHIYNSPLSNMADVNEALAKFNDGYVEDDFYSPDMPVTKYTYELSGETDSTGYREVSITNVEYSDIRRFFGEGKSNYYLRNNGLELEDDFLTFYVIGEPLDEEPVLQMSVGKSKLTSKDEITFEDMALMSYSESLGISKTDWYNAVVNYIKDKEVNNGRLFASNLIANIDVSSLLTCWYEYEITFEAGERITNTVTIPIFPSIDKLMNPYIYEYKYIFSSIPKSSKSNSMKIDINTTFYLVMGLERAKVTGYGYTVLIDERAEGELAFRLSAVPNPEEERRTNFRRGLGLLLLLIPTIFLGPPIFIVVLAIIILRERDKRREKERKQKHK